MRLQALLRDVPTLDVRGSLDREIGHVTRDSRQVRPDSVFVAIVGAQVDGHDFVPSTAAGAVVVERPVVAPAGVAVIVVADTKAALAQLAAALHGHPARDVRVVGVTGTNGKTTVTTIVEGALIEAGWSVGRIGTTGHSINGQARPSAFTTPEAPALQALLGELRDGGVGVLAMEVSSIGLAQHRVDGIDFALGVFTNLTRDHLDFHGDMHAYGAAKARLFTELLRPAGGLPRALLCGDDPSWKAMNPPSDRWLYGTGEGCDIRIRDAHFDSGGTSLTLDTPLGSGSLHSPMIGRHNAQNLACALGICLALGMDLPTALGGVAAVPGVPGRLEVVPNDAGLVVVVDYAHSDDALRSALSTVRELVSGQLWVVFGCGGDRDKTKRPIMGRVAEEHADHVVVSSDNPRHEDPQAILADILAGMRGQPVVEADRRAAIAYAIHAAQPGDAVLIAGKGHETYQQIGDTRLPFDDREEARAALEAR